jgi:hypothetical protein
VHKRGEKWATKRQAVVTACQKGETGFLDVRLGLAETHHAIAFFPLRTLLEDLDAFETLQDVAFNDETTGTLEAFVL